MGTVREDWEDVGSKLTGLGLKLKMHFEQAAKEGRPADEDVVKENLHKVGDAVEQAFAALGSASRDDAVRQDVKDAGRSMLEALDATFSELGERFRSAVKSADTAEAENSVAPDTAAQQVPVQGDSPPEAVPVSDDAPPAAPPDEAPPSDATPVEDN
jgi:hypothetical protein